MRYPLVISSDVCTAFGSYCDMGVATAAGAEALPKHAGACDCCVKIEKLSYHRIDSGLKMTYYPKN